MWGQSTFPSHGFEQLECAETRAGVKSHGMVKVQNQQSILCLHTLTHMHESAHTCTHSQSFTKLGFELSQAASMLNGMCFKNICLDELVFLIFSKSQVRSELQVRRKPGRQADWSVKCVSQRPRLCSLKIYQNELKASAASPLCKLQLSMRHKAQATSPASKEPVAARRIDLPGH